MVILVQVKITYVADFTLLDPESGNRTVPAEEEKKAKDRQVHYGISGSLGDSGMSYAINGADKQNDTTPWNFNVSKSLGGGASLAFEYVDYDDDVDDDGKKKANESLLRLKVDF